jgi:hypothetical protein
LRKAGAAFGADGERQVSENGAGMVSKSWMRRIERLTLRRRHQSKIYAESNRPAFLQIFRDLGSIQTLAVYRRSLRKGRLRDQPQRNEKTGSRHVLPASLGILARAGAGAAAQRENP